MIGPNGAGKTTLLQILAGALPPTAGTVDVDGQVGWVPQHPALYSKLSVAENLRLFARLEKVPDVERTVGRMLEQTALGERADDEVGLLSGGNRQRVNIAIGLLGDPRVLLLDEPSASLDPRQRERLWALPGRARHHRGLLHARRRRGRAPRRPPARARRRRAAVHRHAGASWRPRPAAAPRRPTSRPRSSRFLHDRGH